MFQIIAILMAFNSPAKTIELSPEQQSVVEIEKYDTTGLCGRQGVEKIEATFYSETTTPDDNLKVKLQSSIVATNTVVEDYEDIDEGSDDFRISLKGEGKKGLIVTPGSNSIDYQIFHKKTPSATLEEGTIELFVEVKEITGEGEIPYCQWKRVCNGGGRSQCTYRLECSCKNGRIVI